MHFTVNKMTKRSWTLQPSWCIYVFLFLWTSTAMCGCLVAPSWQCTICTGVLIDEKKQNRLALYLCGYLFCLAFFSRIKLQKILSSLHSKLGTWNNFVKTKLPHPISCKPLLHLIWEPVETFILLQNWLKCQHRLVLSCCNVSGHLSKNNDKAPILVRTMTTKNVRTKRCWYSLWILYILNICMKNIPECIHANSCIYFSIGERLGKRWFHLVITMHAWQCQWLV